jgi:hypothetical protein
MEEVLLNNCNDTASEEANINVLFMDLLNFIGLHSSNSLNSNLYDDYLKMEQGRLLLCYTFFSISPQTDKKTMIITESESIIYNTSRHYRSFD